MKKEKESPNADTNTTSRRDFLKKSAMAGTGFAFGSLAWGSSKAQSKDNTEDRFYPAK